VFVRKRTILSDLVIQFYGKKGKSLTLHKVIEAEMIKQQLTAKALKVILITLEYIHKKGYLHDDLKTNNVIIIYGDGNQSQMHVFGCKSNSSCEH